MHRFRRYLLLAPSLLFGLVGGVWLLYRPFPYTPRFGGAGLTLAGFFLVVLLLSGGWLFGKLLPSFRYAERLLERALVGIQLSVPMIVLLAMGSSVAEEVFFRGALMPLVGVWGQALIFGLLHPAGRKGWGYTLYTLIAGLAFGYTAKLTGSLWPGMLAHFVVNAQGFWELRQRRKRRTPTFGSRTETSG